MAKSLCLKKKMNDKNFVASNTSVILGLILQHSRGNLSSNSIFLFFCFLEGGCGGIF